MRRIAPVIVLAHLCLALPVQAQVRLPGPGSQPHPAVVRVVVPEQGGTAYGSGTLIDVRDEYGLVLTNWHVVRDASGPIEVRFPSGFHSQARSLKVDSQWDLAALVVWRPPCQPVPLATRPPRPGDRLTICGYGSGNYRAVSGRCTQFYAPRLDLPRELVELDVEARQGDSGGPIFNDRGELAGVLFGAGQGTTLGSFEGRVKTFLASLAPDIGQADHAPQVALAPPQEQGSSSRRIGELDSRPRNQAPSDVSLSDVAFGCDVVAEHATEPWPEPREKSPADEEWPSGDKLATWVNGGTRTASATNDWPTFEQKTGSEVLVAEVAHAPDDSGTPVDWFEQLKNLLALIGAVAIVVQVVRLAA